MSHRYARDSEEILLDVADAVANDECPIEYLARQHRARWGCEQ